ncbi:MAG: hypothetical protein O2968_21290, partial [Acidobacteria bacterium]|nr:hypothetical protein [Acidobacteriota bacterium]
EAPNPQTPSPDALAALRETELFGEAMSSCGRTLDTYGRYGARLLRQFERAMNQFTQRQNARAQKAGVAKPQQESIHRRPPRPESEYAPPPAAAPLTSDRWTPYQEPNPDNPIADNPVTLAQSLDPFVRSRLRGDPDRLQTRNTKQTQPDLTHTTETTYQQESAEPRTQVRGPSPPNHPPDR